MKKEELIELIEKFKYRKVLIIGDAILDVYVQSTPEKICREAPVMVYNTGLIQYQCGGAANTAVNVSSLGAETHLLTLFGKDENGRHLQRLLKKEKVSTEGLIKDKNRVTVCKKRILAGSNILMRLDEGTVDEISDDCQQELESKIITLIKDMDAIILSDYGFGLFNKKTLQLLERLLLEREIPLIIDSRDLKKFASLQPDMIKPNYEETVELLGIEPRQEDRVEQILQYEEKLFRLTAASQIVASLDKDGVILFQKNQPPFTLSCARRDDKNAIGAGDTFISAVALALSVRLPARTAVEIAAAAAAIVVQRPGTVSCSNQELKNFFNTVPKHVTFTNSLIRIVKEMKDSGKKIVFTNGFFDIIHKGHIALLNAAKQQGDCLIVGVNSDESVRRLKGDGRPIFSLEERIAVLAELESVDYIISFEEDSPEEYLRIINPHVFVKGGNYSVDTIPEAPLLKKLGCDIKIIRYKEEHYTTKIINRILNLNANRLTTDAQQKQRV